MRGRVMAGAVVVLLVVGCGAPEGGGATGRIEGQASSGREATLVNRVWRVAESPDVQAGQLYVFLSEGTLVIASPNGTPSLGTWSRANSGLIMVEEGIRYPVDIVSLSEGELRIRSHNPGGAAEMRLVPADASAQPDSLQEPGG